MELVIVFVTSLALIVVGLVMHIFQTSRSISHFRPDDRRKR